MKSELGEEGERGSGVCKGPEVESNTLGILKKQLECLEPEQYGAMQEMRPHRWTGTTSLVVSEAIGWNTVVILGRSVGAQDGEWI